MSSGGTRELGKAERPNKQDTVTHRTSPEAGSPQEVTRYQVYNLLKGKRKPSHGLCPKPCGW